MGILFITPIVEHKANVFRFDTPSSEDEIIDFQFVIPSVGVNIGISRLKFDIVGLKSVEIRFVPPTLLKIGMPLSETGVSPKGNMINNLIPRRILGWLK
jgi:hypothetical protein